MHCWLKSLLTGHSTLAGEARLELTCAGLAIITRTGRQVAAIIDWEQVAGLRAIKSLTPRGFNCSLLFQLNTGGAAELWDSMEGFEEVLERLPQVFPSIPDDWFSEWVSAPAGSGDRILLCEREAVTSS